MTPLLFIFLPLCIVSNGVENCDSFEWTVIYDRAEYEQTYIDMGGKQDPKLSGAFTDPKTNKIVYNRTDMQTIVHEIEHAKCIMENYNKTDRDYCHVRLDMEDQAEKSRND